MLSKSSSRPKHYHLWAVSMAESSPNIVVSRSVRLQLVKATRAELSSVAARETMPSTILRQKTPITVLYISVVASRTEKAPRIPSIIRADSPPKTKHANRKQRINISRPARPESSTIMLLLRTPRRSARVKSTSQMTLVRSTSLKSVARLRMVPVRSARSSRAPMPSCQSVRRAKRSERGRWHPQDGRSSAHSSDL